ncbi:MAG: hypothetical protein ACI9J2_002336 [Saprospiraceae bacterium]|jgi:hypothetical protein
MLFKIIIVMLLLFIVISLFTALYRINKDKGNSTKAVRALGIRVGLSAFLLGLILLGAQLGWIVPHGVGG